VNVLPVVYLCYSQANIGCTRWWKDEEGQRDHRYKEHTEYIHPIGEGSRGANEHVGGGTVHILVAIEFRLQNASGPKCTNGGKAIKRSSEM